MRAHTPIFSARGYSVPAFADERTLVVASSNSGNTEETVAALDAAIHARAKCVAITAIEEMKRAGVPILAGTDGQYSQGGDALHSELSLLVQAGLTPLEALQSATSDSAEFMGVSRTSGTIEPGKTADMVLLNANPLDDVVNTRQIGAVILRGKFFTKEELTAIPSR